MSISRRTARSSPSRRARAVAQRSMSIPSACSCFCAPQPPWAMLGGGEIQRRPVPANMVLFAVIALRSPGMLKPIPQEKAVNCQHDSDKEQPPEAPILQAGVALLFLGRQHQERAAPNDALD